jgi:hypothetical protein
MDLAVRDRAARLDAVGPPPYAAGMDLPRMLSPGEAAAIRQFVARVRELLGTELRYVLSSALARAMKGTNTRISTSR